MESMENKRGNNVTYQNKIVLHFMARKHSLYFGMHCGKANSLKSAVLDFNPYLYAWQ